VGIGLNHPGSATAANTATAVKVSVNPNSNGKLLRKNGRSARAKTKGNTGKMHGISRIAD
jgi:hypothetical protein